MTSEPCKAPDPMRSGCNCRCHDNGENFPGNCDHRCCTGPAEEAERREAVEDALDDWWNEDHFGENCEVGGDGAAHSEDCVSSAFRDGYAKGSANLHAVVSAAEPALKLLDAVFDFSPSKGYEEKAVINDLRTALAKVPSPASKD